MRSARRMLSSVTLLLALLGSAMPARAVDTDADGVADPLDNCVSIPNAFPENCDTDQDGYGNVCDGDFNQSNTVTGVDFASFFKPDYFNGLGSIRGTNMDCSLLKPFNFPASGGINMTPGDLKLFTDSVATGKPGPSGLACAGTVPCH